MEVIRFGSPSERPPVLFIHGSYCGAWVWKRFFIPTFEKAGWWGAAISLRGHGNTDDKTKLNGFGINDYLEDVAAGSKLFETPPILIGHSLGGLLAQKHAIDNEIAGMVLMASPSLLGLNGSLQHIAIKRPSLAMQLGALMTVGPKHSNLRIIGNAMFSNPDSAKQNGNLLKMMQKESIMIPMEAIWPDFRRPVRFTPTLALGGDCDAFIPEFEIRYAAHFWKGKSKILSGAPHALMLDTCWPTVAKEIIGWMFSQYVRTPSRVPAA